jgi:hypothetical protein
LVIPDPDPDFLPLPDPGSRGQQKGTGSRIRIPNTADEYYLSLIPADSGLILGLEDEAGVQAGQVFAVEHLTQATPVLNLQHMK